MSTRELRLHSLRQRHTDTTLHGHGKRAGIELDLKARTTEGENITEAMEKRRMTIAVSDDTHNFVEPFCEWYLIGMPASAFPLLA